MDRSTRITLISETYTTDSIGQRIPTESQKAVFASVESITMSEFYKAGEAGIVPEYKLTMFSPEYNGARTVILNGERYGVIRTYRGKNETLELYVSRKVGA